MNSDTTDNRHEDVDKAVQMTVDYVQENEGASFVELENLLEDTIPVDGNQTLYSTIDPKINFWDGISQAFVNAFAGALDTGNVHYHPCSQMVYMVDGKGLDLPLAKRPPEGGYADERWMPVAMYSYPYEPDES